MSKNMWIVIIVVVLIALGAWWYLGQQQAPVQDTTVIEQDVMMEDGTMEEDVMMEDGTSMSADEHDVMEGDDAMMEESTTSY